MTSAVLNDGQANALTVKLQGAVETLAGDETEPAMNKLAAFINQVEAFRDAGILSEAQSDSLLEIVKDLIVRTSAGA